MVAKTKSEIGGTPVREAMGGSEPKMEAGGNRVSIKHFLRLVNHLVPKVAQVTQFFLLVSSVWVSVVARSMISRFSVSASATFFSSALGFWSCWVAS